MKNKECHVILCEPWEICHNLVRKIETDYELNRISIHNRIDNLIKGETPIGISIKSCLMQGEIIPVELILPLWANEIQVTKFSKIYFYNLPEEEVQRDFLLNSAVENQFVFKYVWYIKKKSTDYLSDKEKLILKTIRKVSGVEGVNSFWRNKEYWRKRNNFISKILEPNFEVRTLLADEFKNES